MSAGTRFWNASGLDVSVGASGVDVPLQSSFAARGRPRPRGASLCRQDRVGRCRHLARLGEAEAAAREALRRSAQERHAVLQRLIAEKIPELTGTC